jgi:hypothetical protein
MQLRGAKSTLLSCRMRPLSSPRDEFAINLVAHGKWYPSNANRRDEVET